jgi:hypothetical protein
MLPVHCTGANGRCSGHVMQLSCLLEKVLISHFSHLEENYYSFHNESREHSCSNVVVLLYQDFDDEEDEGDAAVDFAAGIKSSDRAKDKRTAEEEEEEGDSDEDGDQTVEMMDDDATGRMATRFPFDQCRKIILCETWPGLYLYEQYS